jgi:hypothetical protein
MVLKRYHQHLEAVMREYYSKSARDIVHLLRQVDECGIHMTTIVKG